MPIKDFVSDSVLVLHALTHPSLKILASIKFRSSHIIVAGFFLFRCYPFFYFRILRYKFLIMLTVLVADTDLLPSGRILLVNMRATLHLLSLGSTGLSMELMFLILSSILSLLGQI